jgi:Disulphide bond corrector protein DsbC
MLRPIVRSLGPAADLAARVATLVLLATACTREEAAPAVEAKPAAPLATKPSEPPKPPKPTIEDTTFRLALAAPDNAAADQPGAATLTLEALGGYHVNQDYPIKVDLTAPPGLKLQKTSLGRPDAADFSEQRASFALPFSAPGGSYDLTATVDFAVCTKETCVPDQRTVALALVVR